MNRKHLGPTLIVITITVGCVALMLILWAFFSLADVSPLDYLEEPPAIEILQPTDGAMIESGQGVTLSFVATSSAGLSRVDFLVDNVVENQFVPPIDGETTVSGAFVWFGSYSGWHQLSVIAYDLQGRASRASIVNIGVQASSGLPEIEIIEDENGESVGAVVSQDAGQVSPGNVEASSEGGEPSQEQNQPQEQSPVDAGQQQPNQPDPALPELPQQPAAAPPEITRFNIVVDIEQNPMGQAMNMLTAISGEAVDDLGLARIVVSWQNSAGVEGGFTQECAGAPICEVEISGAIANGQWVFALQAFDVSGLASEPAVEMVQVMGDPGLPPAAAEQAVDIDWLREQFATDTPDAAFDAPAFPNGPGFDIIEIINDLFGRNGENAPPQEPGAQTEGQCATIAIEPRPSGNFISLTATCDMDIEGEGRFILPQIGKSLVNTGDDGVSIYQWLDETRIHMTAGETFTYLDENTTCGVTYRYNFRVISAKRTSNGIATGVTYAYVESDPFTTPACEAGSIADVDLRTREDENGIIVNWKIVRGGPWPENLPAEGATFRLTRFEPITEQTNEILNENIPLDLLQAGGEFQVLDENVQCGMEYIYTLSAIASDVDLSRVHPNWLLHVQAPTSSLPCQAEDLGMIELNAAPYWFNQSNTRVRLQISAPAGFAWPQGDQVRLEILRLRQGADQCEGMPCQGIWQVKKRIPITAEIRLNGLDYEDDDASADLRWYENYAYRLALTVDGEVVQTGPNVSVTTPSAPPPPPEIVRMTVTNTCPENAPSCVMIEWQLYEQPQANGYYAQADTIAVERVIGGLDSRVFSVDLMDTTFVDLQPFVVEVNGGERYICNYNTTYRMIAYDAAGHTYGASPLRVLMPDCDEPWNIVVEPR